jgi:hypothetical protein
MRTEYRSRGETQGNAILGQRFVLQMSDVHAGPGPHSFNLETEDKFLADEMQPELRYAASVFAP